MNVDRVVSDSEIDEAMTDRPPDIADEARIDIIFMIFY
jgi:hypothetical protein